ncbi:MAG TPA: lysophospholipid acyltransferase family protein [Mycobacteriales bacterium]
MRSLPYRPWALTAASWLGRRVFGTVFRLDVEGVDRLPTSGAVIVAGNHTGFLDGPLVVVHARRHVRALTKIELYGGLLGQALLLIGQIPVRRGHPDRSALRACLAELHAGGAVSVFPEGTRGTGEMLHIHRGAAWLAMRSAAQIVPVSCVGTAAALPKGTHRIHLRAPVRLVYGEPFRIDMPAEQHSHRALDAVSEQIRVRLRQHMIETGAVR